MDQQQPPTPNDTQFIIGQLSGQVEGMKGQISNIHKRLDAKEEADADRHETFMGTQKQLGERIFDKLDELKVTAHATPCETSRGLKQTVGELEDDVNKVKSSVQDMTTTGRVSWKAVAATAGVAAFLVGSIVVPVVLWYLSTK